MENESDRKVYHWTRSHIYGQTLSLGRHFHKNDGLLGFCKDRVFHA